MGQRIIAENPHITSVSYKLPNKHYVPVDMKYIGIDNTSPYVHVILLALTRYRSDQPSVAIVPTRMSSCPSPHQGMSTVQSRSPQLLTSICSGLISATVSRK